jgi:hypothetical protein
LFRLSSHHTGIIVADLVPAMDSWRMNLGISFSVFEANETNSRFSGSGPDFKLRIGYGLMGVSAIELIQPLEGETIYAQYLRAHGPGIHHLGFLVTDLATSRQQLESHGCSLLMEGAIEELGAMAYYRSQDGHCIIEPLQLSLDLPLFLARRATSYP